MFAELRQSIADWIFRAAVPEAPPVTLVQRRIFILPTRQGYVFALTLLVMLLASINYQLSLGFILTFLLASMAGVAMLHTWRNLAHLKLRPGRCDPVFAGEAAHFGVTIETPAQTRFAIAVRRQDEEPSPARPLRSGCRCIRAGAGSRAAAASKSSRAIPSGSSTPGPTSISISP